MAHEGKLSSVGDLKKESLSTNEYNDTKGDVVVNKVTDVSKNVGPIKIGGTRRKAVE